MPSPALLDFDALTQPIPGDNPAGDAVPFATRKKLDELRKSVDPAAFAENDPMRPEQPKFADWAGIIELAQDTLKESSKELIVVARLTEALTKEHGLGGLRDGMKLFRLLLEQAWDRLNPSIEDGDLEPRAAAFNWLDDIDRGARFPHTIRTVPFIQGSEEAFCWQDWRDAMDGKPRVNKEKLDKAILALTWDQAKEAVDDLGEAIAEVDKIVTTLTDKMGDLSPGLTELRRALTDCQTLAQQVLSKKTAPAVAPAPGAAPTPAGAQGTNGAGLPVMQPVVQPPVINTREQVYQQLEQVSARLLELDPHSPISYLVQRAVRLSKMTLPQLMRVLIRDNDSLKDLDRDLDLGIDGAEEEEKK